MSLYFRNFDVSNAKQTSVQLNLFDNNDTNNNINNKD